LSALKTIDHLEAMKDFFDKLVNSWKVMDGELDHIKVLQRQSSSKIAEYLSRHGKGSSGEVMEFVCRQLKIDRYTPDEYPQAEDMKSVIPLDMALKYRLVPLKKQRRVVWVATSDPTNLSTLDIIERLTSCELEPVFCSEEEFDKVFHKCYGVASDYQNIFSSLLESSKTDRPEAPSRPVEDLSAAPIKEKDNDEPVARLVNQVLLEASNEKASHVHISPKRNDIQILFRIDGLLREMIVPSKGALLPMVARFKLLADMDISVTKIPQEGFFSFRIDQKAIDVKVTTVPTVYGENLVMQLFSRVFFEQDFDLLGMSAENRKRIEYAIGKKHGLILVTGPDGSGKTTLVYSILQHINRPDIKIFTLEDTVAHQIDNISHVQFNPKGELSMPDMLHAIVSQNPDVVMVNEIRDKEVASILVHSALSGQKVISTIHANSAAGVIPRLIGMELDPYLISSTLLVSVNQRLVRKNCPACSEPYKPPADMFTALKLGPLSETTYMRGRGCMQCNNLGFQGRTGVFEVLLIDETLQEMILRKASCSEIIQTAVETQNFRTLAMDAISKVSQGITTLEEAFSLIVR